VGKTERKIQLERPGRRQEGNITMDFNSVDWIGLVQVKGKWRAVVDTVLNLQSPIKCGEFMTSLGTVSFSRRTLLSYTVSYSSDSILPITCNCHSLQSSRLQLKCDGTR